ncbi:hypothetical protein PU560_08535 [Georgenia sp. 10Sc9-8]|uniref:Uncharacterized protein n=1 Tax=Georgenia halotolerans TaxID=3028317 RepID=A0ABT5TWT3_9MICO|nr:hypothetical protein [Georgenia halotolerans]
MSIGGEDTRGTNRPEQPEGTGGPAEGRRGTPSGGTTADGGRSGGTGERARPARNTVGWVALFVAVLLTAWQVVVALTIQGVADASQEVYSAVSLFVTLILAVGAVVLGLVGMSQRRPPRWPALVGLAVGAAAFLVTVASWVGGLMNT